MKRLKTLLIVLFVLVLSVILGNEIYAVNTMDLNITDKRPYTNKVYTVLTPNNNIHTVFKILKNNGTSYIYEDSLYCIRSGLGFGNSATISNLNQNGVLDRDVKYTEKYNLKKDAATVKSQLGYIQSDHYDSMLWIIDNMYLPEHEDAQEMKAKLLKNAGIVYASDTPEDDKLSDDDIEFVQQMALWYFTNYDEQQDPNKSGNSLSLVSTYALSNATEIEKQDLSEEKALGIDTLYKYFIDEATKHAVDYAVSKEITPIKPEIKVNSTSKTLTSDEGYTVIGPFSITEKAGNVGYEWTVTVKDNNGKIIPEKQQDVPVIYIVKDKTDMVQSYNSLEETLGKGEFYLKISDKLKTEYELTDISIETKCTYDTIYKTTATLWLADEADQQPIVKVEREKLKEFDLSLRKYIAEVNGKEIASSKKPVIDTEILDTKTTAEYAHRKNPVEVKNGNLVTYKISVYNEGDIDGVVTKIIDYLPAGLEFDEKSNAEFIVYKENYTETELSGKKYYYTFDNTTRALTITPVNGTEMFSLKAFDGEKLDVESLEIVCKVTATSSTADKVLTNIATMEYKATGEGYEDVEDRDSKQGNLELPRDLENYRGNESNKTDLSDNKYFYEGQEDDDDFDKIVIKGVPFDLTLRKFITKVNGQKVESRVPQVDTSKLNTVDEETGETIQTAKYTHSKEPVVVRKGDIVTYTIRVYNEGELDGYATKVADYIPAGLGYIMDYKANTENFWFPVVDSSTKVINLVGETGIYETENAVKNLKVEDFYAKDSLEDVIILKGNAKINSTLLEDEIIKGYDSKLDKEYISSEDNWQQSTNGTDGLYYRDIEITCIVLEENSYAGTLKNIAEIEEYKVVDENGDEITAEDRDSKPGNVDKDNYNPPADNSTYQQDDDDYEPLELRYFDLALRKFITRVEDREIEIRHPEIKVDEKGQLEYVHTKDPLYVANSDIITYTIRVYNEGTTLGYVMEVSDDIPEGLVFLPEHETNQEYKWKMYDANGEETTDPLKAVEVKTKYLENDLLNPFDGTKDISETNPDYAEVKVAFQVIEENIKQEDRILTNKAQITQDKAVDEEGNEIDIEDEDSVPNKWNEGEDDQDIEKIYVKKFDLSLVKWVTKSIVTVDGKTTTTETGFTQYDNPEPIAKVVIDKNKINKTTVKFVYNIQITNQGEIEGYATEITDYIPEGLEFFEEDNPIWAKEGNNKITTRALEETLLAPGESATVEVVFRWKQGSDNLGIKTNIAEISEDYNDKGAQDIDSEPDNVKTEDYDKQQEDDDDKALVMLEIKTGKEVTYIWLGLTVLLIIAGGIILIQKYVM